jgi:SnoaL-like polyketide cyclase
VPTAGASRPTVLRLVTDDVVYEDVTMGAVNHGKDELRAFGEGFFAGFPDVTFEVTSRFATGTQGGIEWVMRGTHRGDLPGMPPLASTYLRTGRSAAGPRECPRGPGEAAHDRYQPPGALLSAGGRPAYGGGHRLGAPAPMTCR